MKFKNLNDSSTPPLEEKPNQKKPKTLEEIRRLISEGFDEQFTNRYKRRYLIRNIDKIRDWSMGIADFAIRQALEAVRPEKKVIPKSIKVNKEFWQDIIKAMYVKDQGYNQAIDDFNKLKKAFLGEE